MLLSIAIPTYNRAEFLDKELECLVPQLEDLRESVELLISDNCSNDETQSVIKEYESKYPGIIKYYCQPQNIGGEANNDFLISKCQGQYILLLGDDDLLSPNLLAILLPYLQKEEVSIVHWNRLIGDKYCNHNMLCNGNYISMVSVSNPESFIKDRMIEPSFMSSLVFNRKCWQLGGQKDLTGMYGYTWFGRILWGSIMLQAPCIYYYMPLTIQGGGITSYSKMWYVYLIIGFGRIFKSLDSAIPSIYDKWQTMLQQEKHVSDIIPLLSKDQVFYQQYEDEFSLYLSKNDAKTLHFWLHTRFPRIKLSFYCRFKRAASKIK